MKKKIKLGLGELKVNSFVTSINPDESGEIKGGTQISCPQNCRTDEFIGCVQTRDKVCVPTEPPLCQIWSDFRGCTNTLSIGC